MARIVVQYPFQDLGMHQRTIEERRSHGGNQEGNTGMVTYERAECSQAAILSHRSQF